MKRYLVFVILLFAFVSGMQAFIFIDSSALAQRSVLQAQTLAQWTQQIGYSSQTLTNIIQQLQKFQEYSQKFNMYSQTFDSVYRKFSSGDWAGLVNTLVQEYETQFKNNQPTPVDYSAGDDASYLTNNSLYQESASYKSYVDDLIVRHQQVVDNLSKLDAQMAAIREVQNSRLDKLNEYERNNKEISQEGSGETAITEQLALLNQMVLEQLRMQHEQETVFRIMLEKQLERERAEMEARVKYANANAERARNMEAISSASGAPSH